ncbi:branched-chain amino acid transporter permease [Streptomyces sp. KL116D]|uniref:branched-chain amino acid transporter permease n=1 Tax=Streptomyces sp. KL116D TaxID=3045152 RepID=UPI003555D351
MPDAPYLLSAVGVAVAVTWALRALPFAVLAPLRSSATVSYLDSHMPVGVLTILSVYALRDVTPRLPDRAWPTVLALAVTVGLHLWRRNLLLSVFGGTAAHVALVGAVFTG